MFEDNVPQFNSDGSVKRFGKDFWITVGAIIFWGLIILFMLKGSDWVQDKRVKDFQERCYKPNCQCEDWKCENCMYPQCIRQFYPDSIY